MKAEIREHNGAVRLFVNDELIAPDAYFSYFFDERRYCDFADAGYKLYSIPMFFSSKTINEISQAPCFGKPLFDCEEPDWEEFDRLFHKVLEVCPDVLIFPRMNISVNAAWERAKLHDSPKNFSGKIIVYLQNIHSGVKLYQRFIF